VERDRVVLPIGEIALDERLRAALAGRRTLVAGIRPEHLRETGAQPSRGPALRATAELVEWLGAETYVYFKVAAEGFEPVAQADSRVREAGNGELAFVARTSGASEIAEDGVVELTFDPDALHLFDAATGVRLPGR
jgi:multiple sugar transport system ATP-binding protein